MHSQIDIDQLLIEVQRRPEIWDPSHGAYGDKKVRKRRWEEIVDTFIETDAIDEKELMESVLTKKWKNLRDRYARALRMKSPQPKSPYVHLKKMAFLKDIILNHTTASFTDDDDELEDPLCIFLNDSQNTQASSSSDEIKIKPESSRKEMLDNTPNREHKEEETVDDDKLFLLSLVPLLKQVPIHDKLNVRMEIMECISKYTSDRQQKRKKT